MIIKIKFYLDSSGDGESMMNIESSLDSSMIIESASDDNSVEVKNSSTDTSNFLHLDSPSSNLSANTMGKQY
jgi:hypothetical protein